MGATTTLWQARAVKVHAKLTACSNDWRCPLQSEVRDGASCVGEHSMLGFFRLLLVACEEGTLMRLRVFVLGLLLAGCDGGGATTETGGAASATGGDTTSGGASTAGSGGAASGTGSVSASGGTDTGSGGTEPACQTADACPAEGDTCATQAGCCVCEVVPACGDEAQWSCIEPSTDPGCGSVPPEAGTACPSSDLECYYCIQERPRGRSCSLAGEWLEINGFRNCR